MARLLALIGCLVAAFAQFYAFSRTPSPLPATAPAGAFAAGRAMVDIAAMAPVPHPVGSAANARVRDYLIQRMTALGLSPSVQRAQSQGLRVFGEETWVSGAQVENLVGILPGRDRAAPALALMAHYDSVPGSPGAADDITSVADILEIVRLIERGGRPARDVMVVFTDGEEAGLLGARAFFGENPLARHVGFVLNLEARGGGGRAAMFETGAGNAGAIGLFHRTAARPVANSLTAFVYKLLPNDTDFTVAKAMNIAGLNYAFIGRQFDYHSPSSTVAALDQGAVQHMGDEVLGTAKALAFSRTLPARGADVVYGEPVGDWMVAYPTWGGWLVLIAAGLLLATAATAAARRGAWSWRDVALGAGAGLVVILASGLALYLVRQVTGVASGWLGYRPLLARFPTFEVAMLLAALAGPLLTAAVFARGGAKLPGIWAGVMATAFAAAVALQILAPTAAFVVAWPAAAGAACAALTGCGSRRGPLGAGLALVIAIVALAWLGGLFHSLLQGLDAPAGGALASWLAAVASWPLFWPGTEDRRWAFVPGASALAVGVAIALWLNATSPWTARHPAAAEPLYVVDQQSGRSWRAAPPPVDPWTQAILTADGGSIARRNFPALSEPFLAAPARPVAPSAPSIAVSRGADGSVMLHAPFGADTALLNLDLRASTPVRGGTLEGRPMAILAHAGRWTHLRWQAAPDGLTVSFTPLAAGRLDVRYAYWLAHWPPGAKPLPATPPTTMPWDREGSTVLTGAMTVALKPG